MRTELRKGRLRVAVHIVRQVESVQAVDANEQDMLDLMFAIGILCLQSLRDWDKEQGQRGVAGKRLDGLDLKGDCERLAASRINNP